MALKPNTQTGTLDDHDQGSNDILISTGGPLFGDAMAMLGHSRGGNDTITGADGLLNQIVGDALFMSEDSSGGNDVIIGGAGPGSDNVIIGDGGNTMSGHARGGNDLLIGGDNALGNVINADGFRMNGNTVGGNDTLVGGDGVGENHLRGDANIMNDNAAGGNDVLIAGDNTADSVLQGDARIMNGFSTGGNDRLISGNSADTMWGDGSIINGPNVTFGADTFVFAPGNNADQIGDFRQTDHDMIDLSAFGFSGIGDLTIATGVNTVIDFGGGNSVTLVGFADPLTASDFIF